MSPSNTQPRPPPRRWLRRLLWLAAVLVALAVLEAAYIVADGLRDRPGKADVALVLGNALEPDGQPSPRLAARLDCALDLYRRGNCPVLIVSGGYEPGRGDEATAMRDYLVARGVPAESVVTDSHGINTYKSARFTARLLRERGGRSVCVVSQYYHLTRARLALRRFGVPTVRTTHASYYEIRDPFSLGREMAGLVKYSLRPYPDPGGG